LVVLAKKPYTFPGADTVKAAAVARPAPADLAAFQFVPAVLRHLQRMLNLRLVEQGARERLRSGIQAAKKAVKGFWFLQKVRAAHDVFYYIALRLGV
jgi:hypothetical protein